MTPVYPAAEAFQDPTHVNIITEQTIGYFTGRFQNIGKRYGFHGMFRQKVNNQQNPHQVGTRSNQISWPFGTRISFPFDASELQFKFSDNEHNNHAWQK